MKLKPEWDDRIDHWLNTLKKDFYLELGDIRWDGFLTYDCLTHEAAARQTFTPCPEGMAWGQEWQYLWLRSEVILPPQAEGKMIALSLDPGGESTIYVNDEAFGTYRAKDIPVAHHYICDNILTAGGKQGERFKLLAEAYAGHYFPDGHKGGIGVGPVLPGGYADPHGGKPRAVLGHCSFGIWNEDAYQLWMDVMTLRDVMETLADGSLRAHKIARALQNFTVQVDFEQPLEARVRDYKKAREGLRPVMEAQNGTTMPVFYATGNAHLDVAWLWPLEETVRKTVRTFAAQLRLLEMYPDYKFIQSQPQTYAMCKEYSPALYEKVKAAVKAGRWIAEGGMWVEPDTNMASGESLIRQLIHGKRFFKDEFGIDSEILWLPDTFGYSAALPQILNGCGMKYLVTQKIFWSYNGGEQFPYHYFSWQGIDGSRITSFLPTNYTYNTNPATLSETWENRVQRDDMGRFLLPFGYGDGGGGPCRDHVEYLNRARNLEGCPVAEHAHPAKLFRDLEADGGPEHTYTGELYFSAHRGVYTSQAAIKRGNRKAELALREAEIWGGIASFKNPGSPPAGFEATGADFEATGADFEAAGADFEYPAREIDAAWKKTLLNQFHDILPGSSIARVYEKAEKLYDEVIETAGALSKKALTALAPGNVLSVANSLSWERTTVIKLPEGTHALVKIPSCGIAPVKPITIGPGRAVCASVSPDGAVLENALVRAQIGSSGEVVSFILKQSRREFAKAPMNRFLLYKDIPRLFDAWDIDSMYELMPVETGPAADIMLLYAADAKAAVRIKKRIGNSVLVQTVSLCADSRRIEFDTEIEWNELHRLLKVSFPVAVTADEAINEIQYGYIKRPNHRSRAYDKDRFEVCNHRYTALCDESHGAAVLNDCKYGVNVLGSAINLTLLRAAAAPEMRADNRLHRFCYAFTAWEGAWADCPAAREGYELNVPPVVFSGSGVTRSFFRVEGSGSVIIDAVKPAEDGSSDIIVRMYESKRADCDAVLRWDLPVSGAALTDMTENNPEPLAISDNSARLHFRPFEVKTVRLIT